jgi:AcrR family transcriptional regulator
LTPRQVPLESGRHSLGDTLDLQTSRARAPSARGKRELTKAENRRLILDAARRVFAERGFGTATVRDIIGATGLASGTFYNYFKSKEEVFQALRDESALEVRPHLREARRAATTAEEFVAATFRTFFEFIANRRAEEQRGENGVPRMRLDTPEVVAGFTELREDIGAATAAGILPPVDAGYLAAAAIGIAFEMADEMMRRSPVDIDGATAFATQLVMRGFSSPAPLP